MQIYGPYIRKDGRKHVIVRHPTTRKATTVSYPKYLMEIQLGRKLDPNLETIDHKNNDFTDNSFENLRIIPRNQHASEDALRVIIQPMKCVWCSNLVPEKRLISRRRNLTCKSMSGPFCSRKCGGEYGAELQNHRIDKIQSSTLTITKHRTKVV